MGMVLWSAPMVYGAIYVAAWDYFFLTRTERLFWNLGLAWVTLCAAFWLFTHLLAYHYPVIDRIWVAYNERRLAKVTTIVITILCMLCGASYSELDVSSGGSFCKHKASAEKSVPDPVLVIGLPTSVKRIP